MEKKTTVIILAGGTGFRFGKPKQFVQICGKSVLERSIEIFENHPQIDEIILMVKLDTYDDVMNLVKKNKYEKVKDVLYGGITRQGSSRMGVYHIADRKDISNVLIHSASRPFVSERVVSTIIKALEFYPAVDTAVPSPDTIIKVNEQQIITDIPVRKYIFCGQSPQGFKKDIIIKAHKLAEKDGYAVTEDCGLILHYKLGQIYVVDGDKTNIKITYKKDLAIAEKLLRLAGDKDFQTIDKKLEDIIERCEIEAELVKGGHLEIIPEESALKARYLKFLEKVKEVAGN